MQYHELRVLVPAEGGHPLHVLGGVEIAALVHDAIAPVIAEMLGDETAPVVVVWEQARVVAASGAL